MDIETQVKGYRQFFWFNKASWRVKENTELQSYHYVLLEYDWNDPEHYEWVATAPLEEILSWCNEVLQYKEE